MALTIGVVGMGYVGLTLAAALAQAGHTVHGVDSKPEVVEALLAKSPHIKEPGIDEVFQRLVGETIFPAAELPKADYDAIMLSVSTPVDANHEPVLEYLREATATLVQTLDPTLVVVRSTVPIGTSRNVILPILQEAWGEDVLLCMAPERTIQGQALLELVDLPQVVGGLDERSLAAGVAVFEQLATEVVPVSTLETAEMVKLSNNCHTDLIYGFGNEIALIAGQHGIDPLEVLKACNLNYPRPDLCKPGFVGGACLTKDPYIMAASHPEHSMFLVERARDLNEHMPVMVGETVVQMLAEARGGATGTTVAVLGWACKGFPPTDDMRGTAVETMVPVLADAGVTVLGHDPLVSGDVIAQYGGIAKSLEEMLTVADGVVVVNDHPAYRGMDLLSLCGDARPAFVYDAWRVLDEKPLLAAGIRYAGLGYDRQPVQA